MRVYERILSNNEPRRGKVGLETKSHSLAFQILNGLPYYPKALSIKEER